MTSKSPGPLPRFWVEKTLVKDRPDRSEGDHALGKALWSPQRAEGDRDIYRLMREVRAGDVVFHFVDNKHLSGVSIASASADETFTGVEGTDWAARPSYRIPLRDYRELTPVIDRSEFLGNTAYRDRISGLLENRRGLFFNKEFNLNQGSYLTEAPPELVKLWDEIHRQKTGEPLLPGIEFPDFAAAPAEPKFENQENQEPLGPLTVSALAKALHDAGLIVPDAKIIRFLSSLASKRFLLVTGLSGSGKSRLAQAIARWFAPARAPNPFYSLIPVGADWTGNENIIGYASGLESELYVSKPALELIRHANAPENSRIPHFLILDEMNLSHVERYFADVLSAIESGEEIPLYDGAARSVNGEHLPQKLRLPRNLFIVGTVNVDETTYMFSPKVLDRANVIEFRMARAELTTFLSSPRSPALDELNAGGTRFGAAMVGEIGDPISAPDAVRELFEAESLLFFDLLSDHNAEFGFRVANEAASFLHFYRLLGGYGAESVDWFDTAMDAVIVQKLLPKLHGSRPKLEGLLWALAWACGADRTGLDTTAFLGQCREAGRAQEETRFGPEVVAAAVSDGAARYPLSFDKVMRMWRKLVRDQFVTFSEA